MTVIALIRHGETSSNLADEFQGQSDGELHESGAARFRDLACNLSDVAIVGIHASAYRRARQSAEILCAGRDLAVEIRPGLGERHLGVLDGKRRAEVQRQDPLILERLMSLDYQPAEGDSARDCLCRFTAALDAVAQPGGGAPILVVTHGGVSALFARYRLGLPVDRCFLDHGEAHVVRPTADGRHRVAGSKIAPAELRQFLKP